MRLVQFEVFSAEAMVAVNPDHVVSVIEKELRPVGSFWQKVAVIELVTGEKHVVMDTNRNAGRRISGDT